MNWNLDRADLTWLQHLARALVAEPQAADDLMQDTLLAAIRQPATAATSPRAWLAGIARRLAARQFRDHERRRRRESAAHSTGGGHDPADLVARAELAERLANAARSLPEPMRTAILLRFLEGFDVAAIARRLGKPADTVRYRIRRGLELLRHDLGGSDDAKECQRRCRALLLPLSAPLPSTPLPPPPAPAGLTLLAIMNAKTLTLAGLGLLLLSSATLWWLQDDGPPATPSGELATGAPASAVMPDRSATASLATDVRTLAKPLTPTPSPTTLADALRGRVVDETGAAVRGASLSLRQATPADGSPATSAMASATSDAEGRFALPLPIVAAELLARRNGYCREFTSVEPSNLPAGDLVVVMRRGQTLVGRVVDGTYRGVGSLPLIAYTGRAALAHVSPTQTQLRAGRANDGPADSGYEQCRARTDADGNVRFTGLPAGAVRVRSLDPAWHIEEPATVTSDGTAVVWTASASFGVELRVVAAEDGKAIERARARFRCEVVTADGSRHDFGKWVGRGRGAVSFALTDDCLPLALSTVREVVFYGEAGTDETFIPWRAESLFEPGRTVDVRVEVPISEAVEPADEPTATLELQVFGDDGLPWADEIAVRWRCADDRQRTDSGTAVLQPSGRHRLVVPAGPLELEVQQRFASGSLRPWTGEVFAAPGGLATAMVELPTGASVVLARPDGFDGEWFVHAQLRDDADAAWFGSWNYSTIGDELRLTALKPAEWRFEMRRSDDREAAATVRQMSLSLGELRLVDR